MLYPYTLNDHQNLTQTKNYTTLEIKKIKTVQTSISVLC